MNPEKAFYARHSKGLAQGRKEHGSGSLGDSVAKAFAGGGRYSAVSYAIDQFGPFGKALEIGCGQGHAARQIAERVDQVVACDLIIDSGGVADATDKVVFVEANANDRLPFKGGEFDLVVAMMVMEHVFDPFHFCAETARVLRNGGIFVLNVPLITSVRHRFALLLGRLPVTSSKDWFEMKEWDGGHLHYFSLATLKALLVQNGFLVNRTIGVGRWHRAKTLWPTLLASEISVIACRQD